MQNIVWLFCFVYVKGRQINYRYVGTNYRDVGTIYRNVGAIPIVCHHRLVIIMSIIAVIAGNNNEQIIRKTNPGLGSLGCAVRRTCLIQ